MKKSSFKTLSLITILALMLAALPMHSAQAAGSVSLTTMGVAYTQNFDTLANSGTPSWTNDSTLPGWYLATDATPTVTSYIVGTGSGTTGGFYSFGASTSVERALGGVGSNTYYGASGAGKGYIGLVLQNQTGTTINILNISYTGEQWRNGGNTAIQSLTFSYATSSSLPALTASGTAVSALDFASPIHTSTAGQLDGNAAANRTAISSTITGLSIPDGNYILLRWTDLNDSGNDHGLAIDDLSVTPDVTPIPTNPSGVGLASPNPIETGNTTLLTVAVTPGTNPTSTGLEVTANLSPIGGSAAQTLYDNGTNGDVTGSDNVFSYLATAKAPTSCSGVSLSATITDAQGRQGSTTIALTVKQPAAIHDIQGASHISPLSGKCVIDISGIVTAKRSNGFYMEAPAANWDGSDSTSEGIFVFTSSAPAANVGDGVVVTGTPQEFRPSGTTSTNLTTTEISTPGRLVTVLTNGNTLPAPVVLGTGGRVPPATIIEDDATGDVENSGVFDPASDGIDFYESLEGMLVQVNDAVAVGPWHDFGSNREIPVVGDSGANATDRTNRGGVVIQAGDFNPERIVLNDLIIGGPTLPSVNVNDSFPGATLGVIDYSFGNFKLEVTSLPAMAPGGLTQEVTSAADSDHLAAATFNVENLAPTDPPEKFTRLAGLIVSNLQSPDVIAIEEIQDNNGVADDGTVDASTTWGMLIAAIQAAGGPTYDYRQIDPVNDKDGGAPGGNIRQGFLFRTDRGLSFIDRPGAGSTTANSVSGSGAATQLQYSPGRIDPTNSAFNTSRKPLAGEFMFNGRHIFMIANHFNSKSGDEPLFGHFQPPVFSSEVQRLQQAQVEHDFMQSIVAADPNADVIVLGDLNDFQFSNPVKTLTGENIGNVILNDLINTLPVPEQYSYVFDGNSEVLDHSLLSNNLFGTPFQYDVVHVNSEFADQASDHEPQVVRLLSYLFSGFFQPVDNLPDLNIAKAGQSIPVKFSLNGDKSLDIFATGYPQSTKIACDSSEPEDPIEETATAGASGLSYDPTTDTYTYVWKTDKAWARTCRQLVVKLIDGTYHEANFRFTK